MLTLFNYPAHKNIMHRIESLLSARLFLVPERVGERIIFVSNLSGKLSLYAMDYGGSIPEPLLPPEIALQNPHLMGQLFKVFPKLGKILIMLDQDGNEDYKPMFIPIEGGYPEPAFTEYTEDHRFFMGRQFPEEGIGYFGAASHKEAMNTAFRINYHTGEIVEIHKSIAGGFLAGINDDHSKMIINEGYTVGDNVLYLWENGESRVIYGTPIHERKPDETYPLSSLGNAHFVRNDTRVVVYTAQFEDTGGLAWFDLDNPTKLTPVPINGKVHTGAGEFEGMRHLTGNRFGAGFNIDGVDWVYEAELDEDKMEVNLTTVVVGQGELANGVIESLEWDKTTDSYSLSFSTATSPSQIYTIEEGSSKIVQHTRERLLGLPTDLLSPGEDASFISHDGLRCSARLYLPNESLGHEAPYPLVYYIHGGPQSQERPDFAWFSMPLIQFLTLNGFAVFVPNVRGSTGYGLSYTKKVDRDWGGDDRLDHVHAMTKVLPHDPRVDTTRAAVTGRSYGGYMTLTLAGRHPDLWKASCDMFGPYDLFTFLDRLPPTWQPYFKLSMGDPDIPEQKELLIERSPKTYIDTLGAPMLVIQGANDPRVVEQESRDLVDYLNSIGKEVEYLMFPNEGHDVIKFENRVQCYNAMTDFFKKHL